MRGVASCFGATISIVASGAAEPRIMSKSLVRVFVLPIRHISRGPAYSDNATFVKMPLQIKTLGVVRTAPVLLGMGREIRWRGLGFPAGAELVRAIKFLKGVKMAAILLAEDDESMRRFLKKALEKAGHAVVDAAQGDEALTELQLREFDLLLTDIVMPVMDGIELARRAAQIDPEMKIMFITGFAAVALNPANRAPEEAKVLSKPFHLKDLVQEVERMVAA